MTPERWRQVEAVLDQALDLPDGERAAFLASACGADGALRVEVERLLAAMDAPDLLPDTSAARYAAALVARGLAEGTGRAGGDPLGGGASALPGVPERVGRYRILREAGQGGMGTVYVAERDDGQFRKRVALKLVRRGLHLDERFVRRFVEERRILARLEHPNVARLLDGGVTDDGLPYYVMELIDGEPIDRFCDRRTLGVDERLALFCRVCGAVAYAHERGVVHRDLKPSNILVGADGEPKLLDFGIAKLLRDAVAFTTDAPGPTLTRTGQRLLTPEYASPEQVRGEEVTAASDVYALGVLLYELLTGRRPYRGPGRTAHDVERAILEEEPTRPSTAITRAPTGPDAYGAASATDVSGARATTPDRLRQKLRGDLDAIVLTALRKEPARRYASADDFAADVRRHLAGHPVYARGDGAAYRLRKLVRRNRISVAAAAVGMAAGVVAIVAVSSSGAVRLGTGGAPRLVPGVTRRVAFSTALELDPALSPDGRSVAYAADSGGAMRIYVRPVAGGRAVALTASLRGYHRAPRWSPDGREVAFQSEGRIYAVPVGGGVPRVLVRPDTGARWVAYPAWSPDGRELAYVQDWAIWVRPAAGGSPRRLPIPQPPREPHSLAWSPDGRWLAFANGNSEFTYGLRPWGSTVNLGNGAPSEIWLVPAVGGRTVRITGGQSLNTSPTWLPDASGLLFVSNRDGDRDVYRVLLDADGHPAGGAPAERVTAGLGAHTVALSRDGQHLVYAVFRSAANVWSIPIPAPGAESAPAPIPQPVTRGSQTIEGLSVSPDGRWLAFDTDRNGNQDIYIAPTRGNGEPAPITSDPADEFMPHWAPDGRELAFYRFGRDGRRAMMTVPVGGGVPRPVVDAPGNQRSPHWSPDGRALVFSSDEATGRDDLYLVERDAAGRWGRARRLTTDGGYAGRWAPDGKSIAFVRADGIWTVAPTGAARRHLLAIRPDDEPSLGFVEWGPGGRTLLYKWVDDQGRASFWSLPSAGGRPRRVASLDDPQRLSPRPEFATDGHRIFFTVAERESDVWTMALGVERP